MAIAENQTLVVGFAVRGDLCYLSHHETVAMFQRALVRAGMDLYYTQGFNPRIKMSVPFPRPVGVTCCDELFTVRLGSGGDAVTGDDYASLVCSHLPEGCDVNRVELADKSVSFSPCSARYSFHIGSEEAMARASKGISDLRAKMSCGEPVEVERREGNRGGSRRKDILPYIESVEECEGEVRFVCHVRPEGTARVDELLGLLGVERCDLSEAIRRDDVKWIRN